jgi:hypothetical protein
MNIRISAIASGFGIALSLLLPTSLLCQGDIVTSGQVVAGTDVRTDRVFANELRGVNGAPFFESCATGQYIRAIFADGNVDCRTDATGGGSCSCPISSGGIYSATGDLDMGNRHIRFDKQFGLISDGGAQFKTGINGGTFQFRAGSATSDLVVFRDELDDSKVRIENEGTIRTEGDVHIKGDLHVTGAINNLSTARVSGGQKICSTFDHSGRDFLTVESTWGVGDCAQFRDFSRSGGNYQLLCLLDTQGADGTRFSYGKVNGAAPGRNCGW